MVSRLAIAVALCGLSGSAAAEPQVLRFASAAPDGTAWARELRAFSRDVSLQTGNQVQIKWYLGGIAGDEITAAERVKRHQLDGIASGGMLCQRPAPSMRVLRLFGIFESREEADYVAARLRPVFDEEFSRNGFVNLGELELGPEHFYTRSPVKSLADLRAIRMWIWDIDDALRDQYPELGISGVLLPVDQAGRAYEENRTDGFFGPAAAVLAFQWSTKARYRSELAPAYLFGCTILANAAFDALSLESQQALRAAAAKLRVRLDMVSRNQDDALLNQLFARHGIVTVPAGDAFRAEFDRLARAARDKLGDKLVPAPLLERTLKILSEYRSDHRPAPVEKH